MKVFNNLEEMKPYYNKETNIYEFIENNRLIDIKIDFDLNIECDINAWNINASNINSGYINAWNINSGDINSRGIKSYNINACNINAWNINASNINSGDINAWNINSGDINAWDINARDINARDINAIDINANNISFYAVCFAYKTFVCNSIEGRRENSKYFCLDSDVVIKSKKS